MRARQKKRQQTRRLTIIITVVIIAISIAVGVYFVSTANGSTTLDQYDGQPISSAVAASLQAVSTQPYGPAATSVMQSYVQSYGGSQYISNGKPEVVFIGGEFCPYCAVERWAIVMALERFGNFTNLHYMTSANDEGDYATLTFVGSSYTSSYIAFRPFEAEDRSGANLQTVPSNYSAVWSNFGSGFPFLDFENAYVIKDSLLAAPQILAGKNWTAILNDIGTSDSVGLQIREAANMITGVICQVTNQTPAAVCTAPDIITSSSTLSGPTQASQTMVAPASPVVVQATYPPAVQRRLG